MLKTRDSQLLISVTVELEASIELADSAFQSIHTVTQFTIESGLSSFLGACLIDTALFEAEI
jgi:hypothetical protein